jgi:hypothetical protein
VNYCFIVLFFVGNIFADPLTEEKKKKKSIHCFHRSSCYLATFSCFVSLNEKKKEKKFHAKYIEGPRRGYHPAPVSCQPPLAPSLCSLGVLDEPRNS